MDASESSTKPRIRYLTRFSLRAMLVGTTVVCVFLGLLVASANRQGRARREIQRLGGYATYEGSYVYSGQPLSYRTRLLGPLTSFVDTDLLLPITFVATPYLEEPTLAAGATYAPREIIHSIADLPHLESLSLTHCELTNVDLKYLSSLNSLETLNLMMTKLHEGPLPGLEALPLKTLLLNRTRVDDDSLASLCDLNYLEYLDLTRTKVTDAGLPQLAALPNLKKLVLRRTLVTEIGYTEFANANPTITVSWEPLTFPKTANTGRTTE